MTISLSLALFGTWSLPGELANALDQDLIYIYTGYIYIYCRTDWKQQTLKRIVDWGDVASHSNLPNYRKGTTGSYHSPNRPPERHALLAPLRPPDLEPAHVAVAPSISTKLGIHMSLKSHSSKIVFFYQLLSRFCGQSHPKEKFPETGERRHGVILDWNYDGYVIQRSLSPGGTDDSVWLDIM